MKKAINETIWLLGILLIAQLVYWLTMSNSAIDINMHDTFIVVDGRIQHSTATLIVFTWFIIVGFVIYLTRVLFFEFKIIATDIILVVFACLSLYFLSDILFVLHPASHLERLPRLSEMTTSPSFNRYISPTHNYLPAIIKTFLIVVLAFTSFMTGRNFKSRG